MEGISISRSVESISFDETNKLCLIRFWANRGDSENEIENTSFYTIVKIEALKLFGGIPKTCHIRTTDKELILKKHFKYVNLRHPLKDRDTEYKPAEFIGISYEGADRGLFKAIQFPNDK